MATRKPVPTGLELEIMHVVWRHPSVTVRDVYEELLQQRKIAYTTVMTMMGILERKGYLQKKRGDKAHLYRPSHPKSRVMRSLVNDFVTRVFNGSAKPLLVHLLENEKLSEEELEEIAGLMRERRKQP
jgi:predicted transcriptional regulator